MRARVHKCHFLQPKVDYLGYVVGDNQITVDPQRIQAVQSWPPSREVTELRAFLGLANTLHRFIPNHASHIAPLTDLLKGKPAKNDLLPWKEEHQQAFEKIKNILTSPETLHVPDPDLPMILHTDWSLQAIGGWVGQEVNGIIKLIAYESRKLQAAERNYSPYEGELLALVYCLKKFRPYLMDRPITL